MRLKSPTKINTLPLITFVRHRDRYKVDKTYQRENGTWSRSDEQYLIDTILRGFGMPPIFIHEFNQYEYIVDGQQRLNTIWKFGDSKLPLNLKYSEDIINDEKNKQKNNGKPAYKYIELHKDWQNRFDSYNLLIIYLEDYNDEEIRDLFRRLQHGKPLIPGEILNAYPGEIVLTMRKLADHNFLKNIVAIKAKRYKHYHLAAQFLLLESKGVTTITPNFIYEFFERNSNLTTNSKNYLEVNRILNYIYDVFQGRVPELRKSGWIITLYLLVSYLIKHYSIDNKKNSFKTFFINFYKTIMRVKTIGEPELLDFKSAITKGTNNQTNIQSRHNIILKRFLNKYNPMKLDENRIFNDEQKTAIYRRDKGKCQICGKKLIFNDPNTHFHHKVKFIYGGKTKIKNGLLVCKDCHQNKIHGSRLKKKN